MDERERLLRDTTAFEALMTYGERHNDLQAQAIAMARMAPSNARWTELIERLEGSEALWDNASLDLLDESLSSWPDLMRQPPVHWAYPVPSPLMRIGRILNLLHEELQPRQTRSMMERGASLNQITHLEMGFDTVPDEVLCAMVQSPHIGSLKELIVVEGEITDRSAQAIAESPHMSALEHLQLTENLLSDDALIALAASPHMSRLTYLDMSANAIGEPGLLALVQSPHIQSLQHLELDGSIVGDDAVHALANAPSMSALTTLDLSSAEVGDEGISALARSPHLKQLRTLHLEATSIESLGVRAIANHMTRLAELYLGYNSLSDEDVFAIANAPGLSTLTTLRLNLNIHIGDAGARAIANSEHLRALTVLDLRGNSIGEEGVRALAHSENMRSLKTLVLNEQDGFAQIIAESPCLCDEIRKAWRS